MTRAIAVGGAAAIALAAGYISPTAIGFGVAAVAVLGFWRLLDSLKRGVRQ
jgi:hypothetical protein